MRRGMLGMAVAVAALAMSAGSARAEFFDFRTTPSVSDFTVTPNGGALTSGTLNINQGGFNQPAAPYAGVQATGSVNEVRFVGLRNNPADFPVNGELPDGTNIVFGQFDVVSTAPGGVEDFFDVGFRYSVTFTNYEDETRAVSTGTGVFVFVGRISGEVGNGQSNLQVYDFVNNAANNGTIVIGGVPYTFGPPRSFTNPGINNNGAIGAHVVAGIPEPASLALLGLGGLGALAAFRRRRAA